MSDKTLSITITAKDAASPVFKQVASGAETMGKAVDQAGKTGGSGLDQMSKRAAAFGAALSATGAILGQWSRSSQDAAAIQRQLEQAIANTGQSFAQYAGAIERAQAQAVQLGIDDEKASQAIQALTEITGNAGTALDLLGTAEDLAAAKGMDLVSAAELIGKVHEGNVGILQRYGIVVDKNATAEEALAQIQQQVAGQAEAHATTYARLREELSNLTDTIGGAVGGFAPFLQLLPGVSSGITLLGGAIGALVPEMVAAEAAALALEVALGPVGLVLAAGAAGFAIGKLVDSLSTSYAETVADATTETERLVAAIDKLAAAGSAEALVGAEWRAEFTSRAAATQDLDGAITSLEQGIAKLREAEKQPGVDNQSQIDQMQAELTKLELLRDAYGGSQAAAEKFAATEAALTAIITDSGPGAAKAQAAAQAYFDALESGILLLPGFEDKIIGLAGSLAEYDKQAIKAGTSTQHMGARAQEAATGIDELARAQGAQQASLGGLFQAAQKNAHAMVAHAEATTQAKDAAVLWEAQATESAFTLGTLAQQASAGADGMRSLTAAATENESALDRVARGSTSAAVQLAAFKQVQDGILGQQDVFNQQFSEYGSQLSAIERAQKILNDRQAEGMPITQEQQEFLDNAAAAQERLTGGQEDAAIAAGELAVAYGENMSKGDAMNASLDGVAKTSGDLTKAIRDLIGALQGVPPDTHATVSAPGAAESKQQVDDLNAALNALDGRAVTTSVTNTITNVTNNVTNDVNNRVTGGTFRHGGVVAREAARNGLATSGRALVTVGEAGPEQVLLPAGSYVRTAAASSANRGGGGGVIVNVTTGPVHGFAGVDEFAAALSRTLQTHLAGVGF